jgi:hypothetical protein
VQPFLVVPWEIDNLDLFYQRAQLCHDSEVGGVLEGVVISVVRVVELDDECMSNALLVLIVSTSNWGYVHKGEQALGVGVIIPAGLQVHYQRHLELIGCMTC